MRNLIFLAVFAVAAQAIPRAADTPVPLEVCLLPKERGRCLSAVPAFAFIKEKNRCEAFTYTGCGGNANRFDTAEQCYKSCGGDTPLTSTQCEHVKCDLTLSRYYEDRGCRPQYQPGACCPIQYVCPEREVESAPSCSYRGVLYSVGEHIPQITQDDSCKTGCFCHGDGNSTEIVCENVKCFHPNEFNPACTGLYDHNSCCPTKYICPGDETSEEPIDGGCYHKGTNTTYYKGQYMPSDHPCKSCICLEGPDGNAQTVCKDVHCTTQRPAPDCVPFYAGDANCCPVRYICPESVKQMNETQQDAGTRTGATLPAAVDESSVSPANSSVINPVQRPGIVPTAPLPAAVDQALPAGAVNSSDLIPGEGIESQDIEQRCLLPKEVGPCRGFKPLFYHDADQRKCLPFNYGGCKGNENRFDTERECNKVCNVPARRSNNEICNLPRKHGRCSRRYYFDAESGTCKVFSFADCFDKGNNFRTEEECLTTCAPEQLPVPAPAEFSGETQDLPVLGECVFGNLTLKIGESVETKYPCIRCTCHTPPAVSCTGQTCPSAPVLPDAVCRGITYPGQCCSTYECFPNTSSFDLESTSPSMDELCLDSVCPEGKLCKVLLNEAGLYPDCVPDLSHPSNFDTLVVYA